MIEAIDTIDLHQDKTNQRKANCSDRRGYTILELDVPGIYSFVEKRHSLLDFLLQILYD